MKHIMTYLAHYAAIVAGAAAFIGTHTAIITAVATAVSPGAVAAVAGVTGVAAAIVAALHALGIDPSSSSPPSSSSASTPKAHVLATIAAGLIAMALWGCTTFSSALSSPSSAPYVQAAVLVAVSTAESKGITAAQINAVAKKALAADSGTGATLASISGIVDQQIVALGLPAGDQAAADLVVAALSAAIQTQLQGNPTLAQAQTAAALVINDVIAATGG